MVSTSNETQSRLESTNPQIPFFLLLPCSSCEALPDEGPKISGGRARYQLGEWVDVNCTSGRSRPATQLSWFINGDLANPDYLRHYETIVTGREGLETSTLGLRFKVKHKHFRKGDMKLKVSTSRLDKGLYRKGDDDNNNNNNFYSSLYFSFYPRSVWPRLHRSIGVATRRVWWATGPRRHCSSPGNRCLRGIHEQIEYKVSGRKGRRGTGCINY